jgi:(p)ppGpp synthase/HD superfamily hydrolase
MMLYKAYKFAEKAHRGQVRKYVDEPYINHPVRVMMLLNTLCDPFNYELLSSALLHDTIEDCGVSYDTLKGEFSKGVADLVLEVTNYSDQHKLKEQGLSRKERNRLDLEHLKTVSPNAKLIKLCDRICNLSDFDVTNAEARGFFQSRYLNESRDLLGVLGVDSLAHKWAQEMLLSTIERAAKEIRDFYGKNS